MQELAETIRDHAHEIIDRWDEQTRETEPHLSLDTRDERMNRLVEVITTLAFASVPEQSREVHEKALFSAARHGAVRGEQGFGAEAILKEYYFLRHALWAFIREHVSDTENASKAIGRIDQAATLTSRAALLGLNQRELEKNGKWPEVIEDLVHMSPFLAERE